MFLSADSLSHQKYPSINLSINVILKNDLKFDLMYNHIHL